MQKVVIKSLYEVMRTAYGVYNLVDPALSVALPTELFVYGMLNLLLVSKY
jgi:hypothetical protein